MTTVAVAGTAHLAVVERLTRLLDSGATPGLQYTVVTADEVLCAFAGGTADIAMGRPMDSGTTLMAYSMTKTITAIAILQLVESGRIGLDEMLGDWMPYGADITPRQLLTHTAGIPSPLPLRWVHPAAAHADFDERGALAEVVRAHARPASPPRRRYRYSNIGYWLLGDLVERASGIPFRAYVEANIISRLGIKPHELGFEVRERSHHAAGYLERYSLLNLLRGFVIDPALVGDTTGRWVHVREHYLNGAAVGGLLGTARAFGRVLRDQLSPRSQLLGEATRRLLETPQTTGDGRPVPMTPGWHVGRDRTRPFFFKEGGGGGYRCMMRLYPATGIGSVLMTNATGINVARAMDELDGHFIGY